MICWTHTLIYTWPTRDRAANQFHVVVNGIDFSWTKKAKRKPTPSISILILLSMAPQRMYLIHFIGMRKENDEPQPFFLRIMAFSGSMDNRCTDAYVCSAGVTTFNLHYVAYQSMDGMFAHYHANLIIITKDCDLSWCPFIGFFSARFHRQPRLNENPPWMLNNINIYEAHDNSYLTASAKCLWEAITRDMHDAR